MNNYTHFADLAKEVEPPEDGILTRTLINDDDLKAVIFGFGRGEELSEHTASMQALYKRLGFRIRHDAIADEARAVYDLEPVPPDGDVVS